MLGNFFQNLLVVAPRLFISVQELCDNIMFKKIFRLIIQTYKIGVPKPSKQSTMQDVVLKSVAVISPTYMIFPLLIIHLHTKLPGIFITKPNSSKDSFSVVPTSSPAIGEGGGQRCIVIVSARPTDTKLRLSDCTGNI